MIDVQSILEPLAGLSSQVVATTSPGNQLPLSFQSNQTSTAASSGAGSRELDDSRRDGRSSRNAGEKVSDAKRTGASLEAMVKAQSPNNDDGAL